MAKITVKVDVPNKEDCVTCGERIGTECRLFLCVLKYGNNGIKPCAQCLSARRKQ
jgi:hypothetical protein